MTKINPDTVFLSHGTSTIKAFVVMLLACFSASNIFSAPTTTFTISNPTSAVGAANICVSATKVPIHAFIITANGTGTGSLTNFSFHPSGTFAAADLVNYKIWFNTVNSLASATLIATNASPGTSDPQTFTAFAHTITGGVPEYFWITIDVAAGAISGRTITIGQSLSTDMTTTLTKAGGPVNASGTQTIIATTTPTAAPTALLLTSITSTGLSGSFTAASPAANGYLVVRSTSTPLSGNPVDGTTYSAGNSLGGGTVVQASASLSFVESTLSSNTLYYYFIFSYNNTCAVKYYTTSLQNSATTCAGLPTAVNVSSITSSGFTLGWTAPGGGATNYTIDISLTNFGASIAGFPQTTASTSLAVAGLSSNTTYYYKIRSNAASCNSAYITVASTATACVAASIPYSESFDGAWTIPASLSCWTQGSETGNFIWHKNNYTTGWSGSGGSPSANGYTGGGTDYYARFHSYDANPAGGTGELISPTIDLSTDPVKYLKFYFINVYSGDKLTVKISTDNGSTFPTTLLTVVLGEYWTPYTIDLSSYNSATCKIKFIATSDWGNDDIGIDQVDIYVPSPIPAGNYNVGAAQTYPTIAAAFEDLQLRGISGAVNFLLTDAAYNSAANDKTSKLTIGKIVGASTTNTITFKPATGVTSTITVTGTTGITLNDAANNIIFDGSNNASASRNLTITVTTAGAVAPGDRTFYLRPGCSNCTIKNCIITGKSQSSMYSYGIWAVATVGASVYAAFDNNTIDNNLFTLNWDCIFMNQSSAICTGNKITNNVISTMGKYGINITYNDNLEISGNTITDVFNNGGSAYGIYCGVYTTNAVITKNKISGIYYSGAVAGSGGNGIYMNCGNGSNIVISNNFIWKVGGYGTTSIIGQGKTPCGILIEDGTGCLNVFHNTIYMENTVASGIGAAANVSAAIAIYGGGGTKATGIDMQNNILYNHLNNGGNTHYYSIYISNFTAPTSPTFSATTINRNNYYAPGAASSYIANYEATGYTLATWKTLTGTKTTAAQDANSFSADPNFVSATDLHLAVDDNNGAPLAAVPDDIDYGTRSLTTPDVGADEYNVSLPIELIYFKAGCENKNIKFNWATASETNNNFFTVEHSKDAINFSSVTTVNGSGTTTSNHYYSSSVIEEDSDFHYYRLKQTDHDERFSYSNVIYQDCSDAQPANITPKLFPNPATNELNISFDFPITGNYHVSILNVLGSEIKKVNDLKKNNNDIHFLITDLSEGIYFLKIEDASNNTILPVLKFIVKK